MNSLRSAAHVSLASVLTLLLAAGAVVGQATPPTISAADSVWTGTHVHESRWLHGEQSSAGTGFNSASLVLVFDSISDRDGRRYVMHTDPPLRTGRIRRAELRIDEGGELMAAWLAPDDLAHMVAGPFGSRSAHGYRTRNARYGGSPLLEDARLWDIAPLQIPAPHPGAATNDTLRFSAARFGFEQSLTGPRRTVFLRDTLVDGRRLWIGHDSARVEVRERRVETRRSLDTLVVMVERVVRGTLEGTFLYDPETGLFRARQDTLIARGEATLRLPDGRVYRSPASFERRVDWTVRSLDEQQLWEEEEARQQRQNSFSIVLLPKTPLQHRLAGGDTAAADSLLDMWSGADAEKRHEIEHDLLFITPDRHAALDSIRREAGGPASRISHMARRRVWGGPPLDSAEMAEYLTFLRDPGLPFASDLDNDLLYENLSGGLVMHPPTLAAPPGQTSCTPAACRLVAAERDAVDPRLRKVALVASFILEPERWADPLLARDDTASHLLHPAVLLARGVGATWPAAEKRPLPELGAGWGEWRRWTGVDSAGGQSAVIRWQDTHTYAVRMAERLTGRDIGAELVAALDTTSDPVGRSVLRSLALQLGAIRPTLEEVVAGVLSSDPQARAQARTALSKLEVDQEPADSALQHELASQLLRQAVDGDSIWDVGPDGRLPDRVDQVMAREAGPLFLDGEHLPASVEVEWQARPDVEVISWQEFRGQPSRSPGVLLQVGEATTLGPFAWIGLTRHVRIERAADEGPRAWASGQHFLLLRTEEGWQVIDVGEWVT